MRWGAAGGAVLGKTGSQQEGAQAVCVGAGGHPLGDSEGLPR